MGVTFFITAEYVPVDGLTYDGLGLTRRVLKRLIIVRLSIEIIISKTF